VFASLLAVCVQVGSQLHVFGHSHVNVDVTLSNPTATIDSATRGGPDQGIGSRNCSRGSTCRQGLGQVAEVSKGTMQRRYVQYSLEGAMGRMPSLSSGLKGSSSWDGSGGSGSEDGVDGGLGLYCIWDGRELCGRVEPAFE
jgi:hypothetical protein